MDMMQSGIKVMRTINADKFKEQVAAMTLKGVPVDKANSMLRLIDMQQTVITGVVTKVEFSHRRFTRVKPSEHHYEELGEQPYLKYSCPVCEALGNLHQVLPIEHNCQLCGVYLYWGEFEPVAHRTEM